MLERLQNIIASCVSARYPAAISYDWDPLTVNFIIRANENDLSHELPSEDRTKAETVPCVRQTLPIVIVYPASSIPNNFHSVLIGELLLRCQNRVRVTDRGKDRHTAQGGHVNVGKAGLISGEVNGSK